MLHNYDARIRTGEKGLRVVWSTDLHLDASNKARILQFIDEIRSFEPDLLLIGGDISNGPNSLAHLVRLTEDIHVPIYFVLGNHDYYYGSIGPIRRKAALLQTIKSSLHYLTSEGVISLSRHTALIGHDGWSDAQEGNFLASTISLNDYYYIEELSGISQTERLQRLKALGREAANYLQDTLQMAFEHHDFALILTHVPPFREACLYDGIVGDDHWLPHFVSKQAGEAIKSVMSERQDKKALVLCGHTHHMADISVLPNLHVLTGDSELGKPSVQGVIKIS